MKFKQFLPQGMEPVNSDKRFYQTDWTDREMAIQDIIMDKTYRHPLLVSKLLQNCFSVNQVFRNEYRIVDLRFFTNAKK